MRLAFPVLLVLLVGTSLLAIVPAAYADPGITVSPDPGAIPTGGTTSIIVAYCRFASTDPATTTISSLTVRDPGANGIQGDGDDTTHSLAAAVGTVLTDPDGVFGSCGPAASFSYGSGVGGWSPAASTAFSGEYVAAATSSPGPSGVGAFTASATFGVPEFALPAAIMSTLTLAGIALVRRIRK